MALVYNEEQRMLQDTARDFLQENSPVEALRKLRDSKDELGYSAELWAQMAELGWAAIPLPEAYGGLEFGYMGLGAVFTEAGRTLAATPMLATLGLGASILINSGSEAQKEALLPEVAAGTLTLALALEEGPHHDPLATALSAVAQGDQFVLNGKKTFVLDGHSADQLIVVARTAGNPGDAQGLSLFLVPKDCAGLTVKRTQMVDSRNAANLVLDNVTLPADALIGELNNGLAVLEPALDTGRALLAAEMLGSAEELLARTVGYLNEREQFGVKIGTFQALKHRCALIYCDIQLTKSCVLDALSAVDEKRRYGQLSVSLAKAKANELMLKAAQEATQMHGGIGVTDELEIGFFLKRARASMAALGDTAYHEQRYATFAGF